VIASLFSATTAQRMLGNEHALAPRAWAPCAMRFMDLPLYVGLGLASGLVAIVFEKATAASRALFAPSAAVRRADADGRSGGSGGSGGGLLRWIPTPLRPAFGGVVCGLVGLLFPQVLFFGYTTIDGILACGGVPGAIDTAAAFSGARARTSLSQALAGTLATVGVQTAAPNALLGAQLLAVKLALTAFCAGCGLVGGTFAPSLFLGAVLGVVYQSSAYAALHAVLGGAPAALSSLAGGLTASQAPTYAMVGAAAVLASAFKAPLTATLLIFELTRAYEIVLPLLAAAGVGPLVVEWAHRRDRRRKRATRANADDDRAD